MQACHLAAKIEAQGVAALSPAEERHAEGLGLLCLSSRDSPWHRMALGTGGASVILAPKRRHLWKSPPHSLHMVDAVMGTEMAPASLRRLQDAARRPMSPGEVGILASNQVAWTHALDSGWDWCLVLEDDAACLLPGGFLQLLALLPGLVEAASEVDPEWQLLVLSPWGLEDFYGICDPAHIPGVRGPRRPTWARRPLPTGDGSWQRVGPTFHAFGWVYRAPLMRALLRGLETCSPPLNPLDVWAWEVMAEHDVLGKALAPGTPLLSTSIMPGGAESLRGAN